MYLLRLTTVSLIFGLPWGPAAVAQDRTADVTVPQMDWAGVPTRTLTPSEPAEGWGRFSDDECDVSWHAASQPKKYQNSGKDYSATYESRQGRLVFQLTIAKTQTMEKGSPSRFFDGLEQGFFRSLTKAKIKFSARPVALLKYRQMQGRMMRVKTDRMGFAVAYLATDSLAFSFAVLGPDDQLDAAITPFVTGLTFNADDH